MYRSYKYRIYPTEPQKELIAKHIGSSRFVYNLALETKNAAYIGAKHNYSAFDLDKATHSLNNDDNSKNHNDKEATTLIGAISEIQQYSVFEKEQQKNINSDFFTLGKEIGRAHV